MSKLQKMRDRINNLKDPEMLEIARDLLTEMADVQRLKEQIELREEGFTEGKRAAFYFFAQGLDPEELSHAANTANGRLRFIREQKERELAAQRRNGEITEEEEQEKKNQLGNSTSGDSSLAGRWAPVFNNSFGGLGGSFGGGRSGGQ